MGVGGLKESPVSRKNLNVPSLNLLIVSKFSSPIDQVTTSRLVLDNLMICWKEEQREKEIINVAHVLYMYSVCTVYTCTRTCTMYVQMYIVHNYYTPTLFKTDESVVGLKVTEAFCTSKGATTVVAITLRLGVSSNVGTIEKP